MLVGGIISGTSADAIDVALVEISGRGWKLRHRLVSFHSMQYPQAIRGRILAVAGGEEVAAGEIARLNFLLGELFAEACIATCQRAGISLRRLKLIGSHGQTIFHQGRPQTFCGRPARATMQIGEPAVIAERTGVTTVADFRPADIAAGGQGAPLVPYFDYLTYRHARRGRVVLNIGGIANLTAIPAGGKPEEVVAFDTGPGNMLMDALASRLTGGKRAYDAGGRLARMGTISGPVLGRLLEQAYFHAKPPKSAGREQFGEEYLKRHFIKEFGPARSGKLDALATATVFTAESIARGIAKFVLPKFPVAECIASGGGVNNSFLMSQLGTRLKVLSPSIRLITSNATGVAAQAKEAVAFAVLAYQSYNGEPANLPSATGAHRRVVLGKVAHAGK